MIERVGGHVLPLFLTFISVKQQFLGLGES